MSDDVDVEEERIASQLALVALRAILPDSERLALTTAEVVIDGARFASESDAASSLARMSKPLRCRADVHDGALSIQCERMVEEEGIESWRAATEVVVRADVARLRRRMHERRGDSLLLARVGQTDLLIPISAYERWRSDFEIPNLAFSVEYHSENMPHDKGDATLTFWNASSDHIEGRIRIELGDY
jgi:hypothetical protein